MEITFKGIALITSSLVNLIIGTYILKRAPQKSVNRSFALLIYNFTAWSFANFLVTHAQDKNLVALFGYWCFAIGSLIPANFFRFSTVFPKPYPGYKKSTIYMYVIAFLLFTLSFTNLIQSDVYVVNKVFRPKLGKLFPLFAIWEILGVSLGLRVLYRKWKASRPTIERLQLKILFTGILISATIALLANVVLPLFGFPQVIFIGPTLTVIIVGFIGYAIVRYRLFDITIAIKRTTVYGALTAFVTATYIIAVIIAEHFLRGVAGYKTLLPALMTALFIAFAFLPLREKIQNLVDKLFSKKRYEYQTILKQTGKKLARVLRLPDLLRFVLKSVTESIGIENGSIWLKEGDKYVVKSIVGEYSLKDFSLSQRSALAIWMKERRDVVVREELERMNQTQKVREMQLTLERVRAGIAIPIMRENDLIGVIFLNNKTSGDMFTQEDIDLFLTLANQMAVAIENASLYTQVEEAKVYQENVLRNLASGVITVDMKGKITTFNARAEEITGCPSSKAMGRNYKKVCREELSKLLESTLRTGKIYKNREVKLKLPDGSREIPLGVSTSLLKDSHNKTIGAVMVFSDLTEIKRLEEEVREAERLASLGTLAAGLAHEIKNPLVSIKTFAQLLPEKYKDEEFRESFSRIAADEVERINTLINQLLDFAHPAPLRFEPLDIHEVMDETLLLISPEISEKGIEINKNYTLKAPPVSGDRDRLKQVFLNLLLNSTEVMNGRGKITVQTQYPYLERGVDEEDITPYLLIKISDTGKGIPPEVLPNIFDPFFSTKEKGTGLGLAITYRIINEHKGNIEVKSKVGEGTTFLIKLPVESNP